MARVCNRWREQIGYHIENRADLDVEASFFLDLSNGGGEKILVEFDITLRKTPLPSPKTSLALPQEYGSLLLYQDHDAWKLGF